MKHIMINYNLILDKKTTITLYRYREFRIKSEYKRYYRGLKKS